MLENSQFCDGKLYIESFCIAHDGLFVQGFEILLDNWREIKTPVFSRFARYLLWLAALCDACA